MSERGMVEGEEAAEAGGRDAAGREPLRLCVVCHPTMGGSGVVATELAMGLADRGHEVHMIADKRPWRLPKGSPVRFHGLHVHDYPLFRHPPHDLCLANEIIEVVLEHDVQVIHAHYAVPHAIVALLANTVLHDHPVKVVTTVHGTDITLVGSHRSFYRLCKHAMERSDELTAVSHWLAGRTRDTFRLARSPHIITNFVDCERFNPEGRAPWPEDGAFTILHASNFRPVKRVCDVVRAFALIRAELPGARLVMAGDGPERGLAEELCAELGLCPAVEFPGRTSAVEAVFRQSHLFLLLSEYESFGLAALEAMACGTPTIASKAGGLVEVIECGVSGHLRHVGDAQGVADAAVRTLSDRATWERMSQASHERAATLFHRARVVPQYEALYRSVLGKA